MSRFALFQDRTGEFHVAPEAGFDLEEHLQEVFKEHPELIPAEDFSLVPPLLVVGRETQLPSGGIDLVCLDSAASLGICEMKRGPKSADARRSVAQLLDYGSDLWGMTIGDFEERVVLPYFGGAHFPKNGTPPTSLREAASACWGWAEGIEGDGEWDLFKERLGQHLQSGQYLYLLVSTDIPDNVRSTMAYLASLSRFRCGAVLIDHYQHKQTGVAIYVPRALVFGETIKDQARPTRPVTEQEWLQGVRAPGAREFYAKLFRMLHGLTGRMQFTEAGYFGFRVQRASAATSLSDTWSAVPAGQKGFYGFDVLRLGYDQHVSDAMREALDPIVDELPDIAPQGRWGPGKLARYWTIKLDECIPSPAAVGRWFADAERAALSKGSPP